MSATFALIRFKKTGNIYFGCYEGTSDILRPFICTPEECYDEEFDCYCSISYCRELAKNTSHIFPNDVADLDDVEIYADYGGGSYWPGTGSESIKMIKDGRNPYEECYESEIEGRPDWVVEFLAQFEED